MRRRAKSVEASVVTKIWQAVFFFALLAVAKLAEIAPVIQGGAPKIAKLVCNSNNYGL